MIANAKWALKWPCCVCSSYGCQKLAKSKFRSSQRLRKAGGEDAERGNRNSSRSRLVCHGAWNTRMPVHLSPCSCLLSPHLTPSIVSSKQRCWSWVPCIRVEVRSDASHHLLWSSDSCHLIARAYGKLETHNSPHHASSISPHLCFVVWTGPAHVSWGKGRACVTRANTIPVRILSAGRSMEEKQRIRMSQLELAKQQGLAKAEGR